MTALRDVRRHLPSLTCATLALAAGASCGGVASDGLADAAKPAIDSGHMTIVTHHDADVDATHGGDTGPGADAGTTDGPSDAHKQKVDTGVDAGPPPNFGEASTTYPAFAADVPQVQTQGGPTLSSPHIVTVTWPGEPNASAFEAFGDDIGRSPDWTATTSEYGVGPAWSGPGSHVRLTEQPIAEWADTALDAWLSDHLANNTKYGLPAPDGQTLYVLYLSTSTNLSVSGANGCQQGIGGYHGNLNGTDFAYAVILQCDGAQLSEATSSASHELVEAATDPHPMDIPAYYGFDSAHLAWDVFQSFQDEVADACEFYYGQNGSFYSQPFAITEEATFDAGAEAGDAGHDAGLVPDAGLVSFSVQRTWSNAMAAAGHHPCVPAVPGPYFAVTPLDTETVTINLSSMGGDPNAQTLGYKIVSGQTKTFPVGFHSDAPTSGPWTISVSEGNPVLGGSQTSHLTMSIDKPSGVNGDIAYITITVTSVDTSMNGELVTIESELAGFGRTYVPILISNQ